MTAEHAAPLDAAPPSGTAPLSPDSLAPEEAGSATTLVAEEAPHHRRLLAFWKHGSRAFDLPDAGTVTIGRGKDCEIQIDHPSVSRRHARLHLGPRLRVEDLGSSNGTSVAGRSLSGQDPSPVDTGVVIEVGSAMLLVQGGDEQASASVGGATPRTGDDEPRHGSLVVQDPSMERLHRLAELVAKSTISVILLGETGVGKEVFAESIHRRSARARRPFVRLNCAALPDQLLESELFGYERGAFTGAVAPKPGILESAHGGTVFLDEVGELPLSTQAKLLRVLESGEVTRVGSLKPRPIDVRFLSATNRDLEQIVQDGKFRHDLYFRLNGISILIPPLRERRMEIALLARSFAAEAARRSNKGEVRLARETVTKLECHDWPGNVRELRNVVERAVLLSAGDTIYPEDMALGTMTGGDRGSEVPSSVRLAAASPSSARMSTPGEAERQRIIHALEKTGGNQKEAAKLLGISRRTLVYRLDTYAVPRPRKRVAPAN